jgi:hypothetical protein
MNNKYRFTILFKLLIINFLLLQVFPGLTLAQSTNNDGSGYHVIPKPDAWYNSVDGLRLGLNLKGEVPGTFNDGPHRLNLGIWGASKLPDLPVSYYISFIEPIESLSDFGSEANIQFISSIRAGYDYHAIAFNKRWQIGFDESNYRKLCFSVNAQKMMNDKYRLFPAKWNKDWLTQFTILFESKNKNSLGEYFYKLRLHTGIPVQSEFYEQFTGSYNQKVKIGAGFDIAGRFFTGMSSKKVPLQLLFNRSLASPVDWMVNGLTRARGTIPPLWLREGWIQVTGGPGLRGYTKQDVSNEFKGKGNQYLNFSAANIELDYPNPLGNAFKKIKVLGDLFKLRSYIFWDSGSALSFSNGPFIRKMNADAGPGFALSLSLPDNTGYMKNIVLRYDIPLWLSNPDLNENQFHYRNVIGLSAIINL